MTFFFLSALLFSPAAAPIVGRPAPAFTAPSTDGTRVSLADQRGKWVVLYFYPKAFTPGCTAQACSLRDGFTQLKDSGAVIYGISFDKPETLQKFKAENKLPFELLSDGDKAIAKAYDAVALAGLAAARKTFIIDPEGRLAHVFTKVDTKSHDREVLEALTRLQGKKPS
jgi:peroxiredoxin Q/BCP